MHPGPSRVGDAPGPQLGTTSRCLVPGVGRTRTCAFPADTGKHVAQPQSEPSLVELRRWEWSVVFCLLRKPSFVRGGVCRTRA